MKSGLRKLAAFMGLIALAGAPSAQANQASMGVVDTATKVISNRPAVKHERKMLNANRSLWKPSKWVMGNQRQNRKHWRQCPWSRPAKNRK